jgi:Peptide methionine sulfoxide reductase
MKNLLVNCTFCFINRGDHTETIEIEYDPEEVTYPELLKTFWNNHDPTAKQTIQVCKQS